VLHVSKADDTGDAQLSRELQDRFHSQTEVHPNRIVFHDPAEMRQLQGVGVVMKEQKIVDHRPRANGDAPHVVAAKPELEKTYES